MTPLPAPAEAPAAKAYAWPHGPDSRPRDPELAWRVLGLLNVFRLLVPTLLIVVFYALGTPRVVGSAFPELFVATCVAYLAVGMLAIWLLKRRWPDFRRVGYLPIVADGVLLSLLAYASGGVESGLAVLALVPLGCIALMSSMRVALLIASLASIGLLAQQGAVVLVGKASVLGGIAHAGYYGITFFLVTAAGAALGGRLRETEALVRQREVDLANLAELSEYIVHHLRESIVVVDSADRIRLINESARLILGGGAAPGDLLGEVSPRLLYLVERWRQHPEGAAALQPATLVAADGTREVEAHFAPLGRQRPPAVLVFLEDLAMLASKVQQTKLAALGRLSASIAHEIRNPVGAMSHAAQLLGESPSLAEEDRRLTEIMRHHAQRVSQIITNVLQLSRKEAVHPERLMLRSWLQGFVQELTSTLQVPASRVRVVEVGTAPAEAADVEVRVDPSHLHQVVWNLCENAVRIGDDAGAGEAVELRIGRMGGGGRPFLEVADRGPGVDDAAAERLFEPFFTQRRGGTGLGLFIARELAQCNGATLLFEPRAGGGSVFRVIFADPQRWEA
jgi:two-component system, NtrC family, sensor histidine kinase PilS